MTPRNPSSLNSGADILVCLESKAQSSWRDSASPNGRQECLPHLLLLILFSLFFTAATTASEQANNWPHPRGGLQGTGVSNAKLADAYEPAWTYKTGGAVLSSAVIVDGVVYVGSEDKNLHAIDAKTGKKKWAFTAESLIDASPVVDNDVVYIGTDGGVLYAIDTKTGKEKWQFKTEGRISGEAGIVKLKQPDETTKTLALVGSHDGLLYCLDAADGKKQWTYETGDYINCGITLDNNTIVLGGCDTYLHMIDLTTGKSLGEVELGGEVAGTPALGGGKAYLGHMQGEVVAVSLKDKKVLWRFNERSFPYVGAPALAGDTLLIGSRGRRLYNLNTKTGEKRWEIRTHGGVEGAPVIAGKRAIFGSAGGRLSIIDLAKGDTVWQRDLGSAINISPALTDQLIVVGSEDGSIYAFKPSNSQATD